MSTHPKAGSNLPMQTVELDAYQSADGKATAVGKAAPSLNPGSFTVIYNWRGNGRANLNLRHGAINAASRVFASASEYNTAWNVDRFLGLASVQVLNVSPYNGGAWVWLNVGWNGPINICISLLVDP